jgi:hypothetical protein
LGRDSQVTWRAHKFQITPPEAWLPLFTHYAERDKITRAIEVMLGPKQYETFIGDRPTMGDLEVIINSVFSNYGLSQGE